MSQSLVEQEEHVYIIHHALLATEVPYNHPAVTGTTVQHLGDMHRLTYIYFLLLLLTMYFSVQYLPVEGNDKRSTTVSNENEKIVVCYFTNWAMYREGRAKYTPQNINTSLCTHINYAFAILDNDTLTAVPSDPWADIDNKFFELVTALKQFGLKVLLAVGGWNNSAPDSWSRLLSNITARAGFVTSVLELLDKYGFDGLDMDYEYPGCPQGNRSAAFQDDKENFNALMIELKQAFNAKYLLTLASAGGKEIIDDCYDMASLCELTDWMNVMTYDYHSYLDGVVGALAPLHGTASSFGVYETIQYYVHTAGCPANKLVLGFPFYGRSFALADPAKPEFGVPVTGPGEAGPYTKSPGFLAYYEICEYIKGGYSRGRSDINGSYVWNNTEFVSFDSAAVLTDKASSIMRQFDLRGAMMWTLDFDDFNDICGCGSYPLLNILNHQLGRTETPVSCY